ncbi:DMT family transporter [Geovibrio thiophilus]|uniref:DMT family transporter n=1 Tax=Geovibrio thiophilus TaxID=139438 RepID=A0A410JUY8_9BACT|nr:DMT family transporter [Geovibrio thiophilus]QAR32010.1 DMT family transporter [Geovibrio thiophilus]
MSGTIKSPLAALTAGAFIISFSSIFARLSTETPVVNGFYRMMFGAVFLTALAFLSGSRFRLGRSALYSAFAGVLLGTDMVFWHTGIDYVGPGLATLLANFQVFFLAVYDVTVEKKPISRRLFFAMLLAVSGLYLLVSPGWSMEGGSFRTGVAASLIAGVFYTGFTIFIKKSSQTVNPLDKTASIASACVASAVFLCMAVFAAGENLVVESPKDLGILIVYGVICQGVGWVLITGAIRAVRLSVVGLVLLLQPTLSWVWEVLIFSKPVIFTDLAGAALAMAAIYLGSVSKN